MSLPLLHAGKSAPGLSAQLDLRFALDKSLTAYRGPTPSFSRASTGTFFNSSGVLTSAAINAPRFNHTYNGTSWISRGLLVEEQRTNAVNYSEDFGNAYWGKSNASVNDNSTAAPDGNTTADKFVENSANSAHVVGRNIGTTSGAQTWSFFAKAAGRNWIAVNAYVGADARTWFDLQNGTVGTNAAGSTASITNVGNGWFRCSVSRTGGANTYFDMHIANSDNSYIYTGDGTSGVFVWGAQLETGAFPTSYIPTTSASVTRSADVCQITGTDFSGFWNGTEGSFVAEYDRLFSASSISNASTVFQAFIDGSNNDRYALFHNSSGTIGERFNVTVGNVEYANLDSGVSVSQTTGRASSAYKLNDFALTVNGGSIISDTSGLVVSNADKLNIGRMYASNWLNGHIARLRYFNKRLPNATLQQLST